MFGPGQAGTQIVQEGLKASSMTETQKAFLLDLISQWARPSSKRSPGG
jgi:hypothetical protein